MTTFTDDLMKPHPNIPGARHAALGHLSIIDGRFTYSTEEPKTYEVMVDGEEEPRGCVTAEEINALLAEGPDVE